LIVNNNNLVSVLIVNRSSAEVLPECLKSVLELNCKNIARFKIKKNEFYRLKKHKKTSII